MKARLEAANCPQLERHEIKEQRAISLRRETDQLAARLGEPYGTLLLTLSVTFVEVSCIATIMLHGANNPTLARDTLFAVAMIILYAR